MKIAYIIITLIFIGWAFVEQTKAEPNIWIQIIGVALFFFAMMKLMDKSPSNNSKSTDNNKEENDK